MLLIPYTPKTSKEVAFVSSRKGTNGPRSIGYQLGRPKVRLNMEEIVIGHGEWDGDVKEDKGKWRLDLKGKGDFFHISYVRDSPEKIARLIWFASPFLSKSKGANPPKQVNTGNVFWMYLACFHRNAYLRVFDWFFPNLTFWYDGWFLNCTFLFYLVSSHMFSGRGWWFPVLQTFFKENLSIKHDVAFGIRVGCGAMFFSKFLITPVWGTLFFPFHISNWLLDLKSFAFASVASSPKLSSAPFAAKKALQFSHWPCVRGSQVGWDDDGWDFLKAKHLHPKYPAEKNEQRPSLREPYAETGDFIATSLTLVGWLSHPPNKRGFRIGMPQNASPEKNIFWGIYRKASPDWWYLFGWMHHPQHEQIGSDWKESYFEMVLSVSKKIIKNLGYWNIDSDSPQNFERIRKSPD